MIECDTKRSTCHLQELKQNHVLQAANTSTGMQGCNFHWGQGRGYTFLTFQTIVCLNLMLNQIFHVLIWTSNSFLELKITEVSTRSNLKFTFKSSVYKILEHCKRMYVKTRITKRTFDLFVASSSLATAVAQSKTGEPDVT